MIGGGGSYLCHQFYFQRWGDTVANISPDMYRNVIKKAESLSNIVDSYLNGKSPEGLFLPVTFLDEIDDMIKDCSKSLGELSVYQNGLTSDSKHRSKYADMQMSLENCIVRLEQEKGLIQNIRKKDFCE